VRGDGVPRRSAGGLYVHLPFCPYLCPYCDFAKWPHRRSLAARYLRALGREIETAPPFEARTLFLGGGTPNTHSPRAIATLVAGLRSSFGLGAEAETTIELNPDRGLCEGFDIYRAAGINRLSIGAQALAAEELVTLGRRHSASDVTETVASGRRAGFSNISIDLMFGIPGQTLASWRSTLERALALNVEHLSTYGLTVEAGTPFAAWRAREPAAFIEPDAEADMVEVAAEMLTAGGFEQYEISNFARPGFACAHNANYWSNGEYLGLGVSAASYLCGIRRTTTADLNEYCTTALAGETIPAVSERLVGLARAGEAAMLALRTAQGVELATFAERYGVDFLANYEPAIQDLCEAGLLRVGPTHVALSARGRLVAHDVCAPFIAGA